MNTTRRVVFLLFALSLFAGIATGSTIYYRFSYLWGFLILVSWAMSYLSLRGVRLRRTTRTLRSQVGQIFEEQFEIRNNGRIPRLWIEVRDESNLPGSRGSHVLTLIGGRESRTYLARTRLTERGVFPLGPTVLASGDFFGLFPVNRIFQNQDSLLVYPLVVMCVVFRIRARWAGDGEAVAIDRSSVRGDAFLNGLTAGKRAKVKGARRWGRQEY